MFLEMIFIRDTLFEIWVLNLTINTIFTIDVDLVISVYAAEWILIGGKHVYLSESSTQLEMSSWLNITSDW